jgi:hypothetical protein
MNRNVKRNLEFTFVIRRAHFERPSVVRTDLKMIQIMSTTTTVETPNATSDSGGWLNGASSRFTPRC